MADTISDAVATTGFRHLIIYLAIALTIIAFIALEIIMYRILRPIAVFIMAHRAGYRYSWVAFVPYGTHYLEFVLPIRQFNIFNWIKTDNRDTIAWTYIFCDCFSFVLYSVVSLIPILNYVGNYIIDGAFALLKWRKYYDLLKTYNMNKATVALSILSIFFKPIYVILLLIMCTKEPDYGLKRYDCPILLDQDWDELE